MPGTSQEANCKYVTVSTRTPFVHPYQKDDPTSLWVTAEDRIFLMTTRAVEADEEIVVDYGEHYWREQHGNMPE
jgi:hypothetical protein